MPLRQPPAEQPFSLIPPNWNPVSNDRVLPHLAFLVYLLRHKNRSNVSHLVFKSGQTGKFATDRIRHLW